MRVQTGVLLASLAFAFAAPAQTEGAESKTTADAEKLWKIEASGISG